jgi:hypothetical protein
VDALKLPTPDNPELSPIWENYIIAQAVQASLGQIPEHALAVGVEVTGTRVRLRFQLSTATEDDERDMADIVSEMEALVGNGVQIEQVLEVRSERLITPSHDVCWIFLARA